MSERDLRAGLEALTCELERSTVQYAGKVSPGMIDLGAHVATRLRTLLAQHPATPAEHLNDLLLAQARAGDEAVAEAAGLQARVRLLEDRLRRFERVATPAVEPPAVGEGPAAVLTHKVCGESYPAEVQHVCPRPGEGLTEDERAELADVAWPQDAHIAPVVDRIVSDVARRAAVRALREAADAWAGPTGEAPVPRWWLRDFADLIGAGQ